MYKYYSTQSGADEIFDMAEDDLDRLFGDDFDF